MLFFDEVAEVKRMTKYFLTTTVLNGFGSYN